MPDGVTAAPNGKGISLRSSETGNLIGGSDPEDRNVISGNTGDGIYVWGESAAAVAGNFVGTNAAGTHCGSQRRPRHPLQRRHRKHHRRRHHGRGQPCFGQPGQRHRVVHLRCERHQREGQPHRHNGKRILAAGQPGARRLPRTGRSTTTPSAASSSRESRTSSPSTRRPASPSRPQRAPRTTSTPTRCTPTAASAPT